MTVWIVAGVAVVVAVAVFALLNRRGGEVIDAPRQQSLPTKTAATSAAGDAAQDRSAGDMLGAQGADKYLATFADWLESQASNELGIAVEQPEPTRRIAEAARQAWPIILSQGQGVIDIPNLVIDASGGRSFRREVDRAQLERAVADFGVLTMEEFLAWREDSSRVGALAAWLADEIYAEHRAGFAPADDETARLVQAARQAVADIDREGRADIVVAGLFVNDKDETADARRSLDADTLESIVADARDGR